MSISSVLGAALSGLRATQAGLDLVARNVAHADQPGYTKKTLSSSPLLAGNDIVGVQVGDINRQLDTFVLRQLWREISGTGYVDAKARYLTHLDTMLGVPGSPAGLDSLYNSMLGSLQALSASPESAAARDQVLSDARALAQALNQTSGDIQAMRVEAERGIAEAVQRINGHLTQIASVNRDIAASNGKPPADLLDLRDRHIAELSRLIDLKVVERDNGQVALFTQSGTLLLDQQPAQLQFDQRGSISPQAVYTSDEATRGVGTIKLRLPDGSVSDLIADRAIRSGELAALIELRDKHLVQAQAQLDAFADALARALSANPVPGEPITGGFEIDASSMLPGDRISLTYVVGGEEKRVTIIRVEDPNSLPLSNEATPDPADTVIGLSFAGGWPAVAAALQDDLPDIVVEADGGKLQFSNGPASTIGSLSASVTATGFTEGLGLPFFVDGEGLPYTASLDGTAQQIGFAGRIKVNPALLADSSHLVKYAAATQAGDPTRPLELVRRLTQEERQFGAPGAAGSAYSGTIGGFLQRLISFQAAQKADADRAKEAQHVVTAQLQERFALHSGVNIDEEMARLIELQTAFQANTRVIQAYREMMAMLMQM